MPATIRSQQPKLLDEVRNVLRLHHYSIHTERSYVEWIVRFVRFHDMRSRDDSSPPLTADPPVQPPPRAASCPWLPLPLVACARQAQVLECLP